MLRPVKSRVAMLLLGSLLGIGMGLMGDFLAADAAAITLDDVLGAMMLSPFAVAFGGMMVTQTVHSVAFVIGGLLFWPVYALLASLWLRKGSVWLLPMIVLWCAQGFLKVVHRYYLLMSV